MRTFRPLLAAALLLLLAAAPAGSMHGLDVAGMDRGVKPGDDFFAFANGKWVAATTIPPDRSSWGVFAALAEKADLPDGIWNAVFDRVQWPRLTFLMGPLLDGHLEGLTTHQQHKDGTDDSVWMRYETETAETIFNRTAAESILDTAFGCTVSVTDLYVGRAIIQDHTLAAVTISLRHIVDSRERPVCFSPSEPALDLITSLISMMAARKWVRWSYTSF